MMTNINLPNYQICCPVVNDFDTHEIDSTFSDIKELIGSSVVVSDSYMRELARVYLDGIQDISLSDNVMDMLEANLFRFSAAKSASAVIKINELAKNAASASKLGKSINELGLRFNRSWLFTEYQTTKSVSQNAAQYQRFVREKDIFPFLKYRTAGDGRVRDEHSRLDGRIFRIDSNSLDVFMPPNGWGCRCYFIQIDDLDGKSVTTLSEAKRLLQRTPVTKNKNAWDKMLSDRFNKNKGNLGVVFEDSQFYTKANGFKATSYGLSRVDRSKYPTLGKVSPEGAERWFDENPRFMDYRNRVLSLSKQSFRKNLKSQSSYYNKLPVALTSPDEVWLIKSSGKYRRRYLTHYNNGSIFADVSFDQDGSKVIKYGKVSRIGTEAYREGVPLKL